MLTCQCPYVRGRQLAEALAQAAEDRVMPRAVGCGAVGELAGVCKECRV